MEGEQKNNESLSQDELKRIFDEKKDAFDRANENWKSLASTGVSITSKEYSDAEHEFKRTAAELKEAEKAYGGKEEVENHVDDESLENPKEIIDRVEEYIDNVLNDAAMWEKESTQYRMESAKKLLEKLRNKI